MSLIKNLIKEPEKQHKSKNGEVIDEEKEEKPPRPIIKSAIDLQRLKLEKLMKNPDKPIVIPETRKEKDYMQTVPTFVRNVMGSSAGAGSGEFHVYRHLRRKEYARQKTIQAKSTREKLDEEYQLQLEQNRLAAETKTAKKRAKRLKKKQHAKRPRQKPDNNTVAENEEQSQASDESGNGQQDASEEEDKIEVKNNEEQTSSEEENSYKIESNLKQTSSENGENKKGESSNQEDIAKQETLSIKDRVDIELESGAVSEKEETGINEPNIQTTRESSVAEC